MARFNSVSGVAEFYSGKSVFVTGGTGFLGKVLIEKLLFSCDGIDKIYVLVREKKGVKPSERLRKITDSEAFDRVKKLRPDCIQKIVPMTGDICGERLGLAADDLKILLKQVSVVFHVAATINFNEPLKTAVAINIDGIQKIMEICHKMEKLEALIHVSTAYCNTDRETAEEMVYPPPESLDFVREMAKRYSDDEYIINKLLGKRPNTYTYTKAFAEDIVLKNRGDLPIAIVRPSIVTSSLREPCEGWIDNLNGPTGLILALSCGVLKSLHTTGEWKLDIIPVDYITNFIVVAATKCKRSSQPQVYNCCTGNSNPITLCRIRDQVTQVTKRMGLNEFPMLISVLTQNKYLHMLLTFFLQVVPAFIVDFWAKITGKKPRQMKIQERIGKMTSALDHFMNHEWHFDDKNFRYVLKDISEADRHIFNFDVKNIDWESYMEVYLLGARKFLPNSK